MAFVVREGGVLWSSTYRMSGKVAELEQNKQVEVCFVNRLKIQVRITGVLDLTGGEDKKRALLEVNPKVGRHFDDEHDPKFVHLEIRPTRIVWKPPGFSEYREVTP
jgi:general stress protein 26